MTDKIKQAQLLATFVHHGQKRQDGEDYIEHPTRMIRAYLMSIVPNKFTSLEDFMNHLTEEQIVRGCAIWLHDTIEDSKHPEAIGHVIRQYFGEEVWMLVRALTHDTKKELYNDYITRVFQHPTAWEIKWLDMIDNTSYNIPDKQRTRYRDACIHLIAHGVEVPEILKKRLEI